MCNVFPACYLSKTKTRCRILEEVAKREAWRRWRNRERRGAEAKGEGEGEKEEGEKIRSTERGRSVGGKKEGDKRIRGGEKEEGGACGKKRRGERD